MNMQSFYLFLLLLLFLGCQDIKKSQQHFIKGKNIERPYYIDLICFCSLLILSSCGGNTKQSKKTFWDDCNVIATRQVINGDTVIVCDPALIRQKKNIPLGLLLEDFKIVKLDNSSEDALISKRYAHTYVTNNYIGVVCYSYFPMKLFRKDGTFIREIGSIGQGPNEYNVIDYIDMDEKNNRIYILPFSAEHILVYDFNGNNYPKIKLPNRLLYGSTIKVYGDKKQVLITQPISPNTEYYVWIQDFDGNVIQGAKQSDYFKNVTSFSESTITRVRSGAIELFNFGWPNGNEYLYHYNSLDNSLVPQFKVKGDDIDFNIVHELPHQYVVEKARSNGPGDDNVRTLKYIVDKETLKGCFFDGFETPQGIVYGQYDLLYGMHGSYFTILDFSSEVSESIKEIKEESLSPLQKEELQKLKSLLPDNEDEDECSLLFVGKFKQ